MLPFKVWVGSLSENLHSLVVPHSVPCMLTFMTLSKETCSGCGGHLNAHRLSLSTKKKRQHREGFILSSTDIKDPTELANPYSRLQSGMTVSHASGYPSAAGKVFLPLQCAPLSWYWITSRAGTVKVCVSFHPKFKKKWESWCWQLCAKKMSPTDFDHVMALITNDIQKRYSNHS